MADMVFDRLENETNELEPFFTFELEGMLRYYSRIVASYVRKAAVNEFSAVAGEPDAREIYEKLYDAKFDFSRGFTEDDEPYAYPLIYKNIIKSAIIMSALLHDIGYPIQFANENKEQLSEFLPTAHFFFDPTVHWDNIMGKLSDSLLRKIVPRDRLKNAFDTQLHGTLSALAFLLYFYEDGSIHSLRPAKRAAVELAALVMADHTNRFDILKDKDSDYHRMTTYRNPLSFLLRFSDDIQEWGRMYFSLSSSRLKAFLPRLRLMDCKLCTEVKSVIILKAKNRL